MARSDYYIQMSCDLSLSKEEREVDWQRQIESIVKQVPPEDRDSVRRELEGKSASSET